MLMTVDKKVYSLVEKKLFEPVGPILAGHGTKMRKRFKGIENRKLRGTHYCYLPAMAPPVAASPHFLLVTMKTEDHVSCHCAHTRTTHQTGILLRVRRVDCLPQSVRSDSNLIVGEEIREVHEW